MQDRQYCEKPLLLTIEEVPEENKQSHPREIQEGSKGDPDQSALQDHLSFIIEIQA